MQQKRTPSHTLTNQLTNKSPTQTTSSEYTWLKTIKYPAPGMHISNLWKKMFQKILFLLGLFSIGVYSDIAQNAKNLTPLIKSCKKTAAGAMWINVCVLLWLFCSKGRIPWKVTIALMPKCFKDMLSSCHFLFGNLSINIDSLCQFQWYISKTNTKPVFFTDLVKMVTITSYGNVCKCIMEDKYIVIENKIITYTIKEI